MAERSKLDRYRAERQAQSSKRGTQIIAAAEAVFLERGIIDTTMSDIAERAGVTRVTVYRHLADRDQAAVAVAAKMLDKLTDTAAAKVPPGASGIDAMRAGLRAFITEFDSTRDAHRYLAMYDSSRPWRDVPGELERTYRIHSYRAMAFDGDARTVRRFDPATIARLVALTNMVMGALARFATLAVDREQGVALATQLQHLEEMALGYFDTAIAPHARPAQE